VTGLTVLIPDEILYTERWNRSTEVVSTSIWASYYLQNFLEFTSSNPITAAALEDTYHRRIGFLQKGVSNRRQGLDAAKVFVGSDALTAGGALEFSAEEIKVINLVMRSGEYMTIKRPVLTRQRYVPVASNERSSLFGVETLYTTQELVNYFDVPADIATLIAAVEDDLPPARPDTLWSWKSRCDDQTILINSGKWDERRDFVFDLWSTITHKRFDF
jgi:hypothetical protein